MVIARSTETMKEMYVWANGVQIPFETPLPLTDAQITTIKRQREPIQIEKTTTVRDIMEKHQVDQAKANQMLKLIAENPEQGGKKITYVSKYIVTPA
jgi:hypothetical protein